MINNYHSNTSHYYYTYKKYDTKKNSFLPYHKNNLSTYYTYQVYLDSYTKPTYQQPFKEEEEKTKKQQTEKRLKFVDKKLKELKEKGEWFDAQVFTIYYLDNHSLNTLAKATDISRSTLHKSITNVIHFLKNEKE
jgi:hypothetical protein